MGKTSTKGRYICKVGHLDIYAKDNYKSTKTTKLEISSTEYNIYHSKKLLEKGFKTKDLAVEKSKEILGEKYKIIYGLS